MDPCDRWTEGRRRKVPRPLAKFCYAFYFSHGFRDLRTPCEVRVQLCSWSWEVPPSVPSRHRRPHAQDHEETRNLCTLSSGESFHTFYYEQAVL